MLQDVLDRCSDALLLLRDGTAIPCSRFVIMTECPVLRVMMELEPMPLRDGKHVIPVGDTGNVKYSQFCAVVHKTMTTASLSFEDAVAVFDAARRLGAEKVQSDALRSAWARAPDVASVIDAGIMPDLLREGKEGPDGAGSAFATRVVAAVATAYPLWVDLEREFLDHLKYVADDPRIVKQLIALQYHYPAASVAKWLLNNAMNPTEDVVNRIATANSHLYCSNETRPVYNEAIKWYGANESWNQDVKRLLGSFMESSAWSNHIPLAPGGSGGMYVEFEDLPRMFASIAFPANRTHGKKTIPLGPCIRLRMPKGLALFGFEVNAGRMTSSDFQVRVTASRRMSFLNPFFEAWYSFSDVTADQGWVEKEPVLHHGYDTINTELLKTRNAAYIRFDVRYSKTNAIFNPFD